MYISEEVTFREKRASREKYAIKILVTKDAARCFKLFVSLPNTREEASKRKIINEYDTESTHIGKYLKSFHFPRYF